MKLKSLLIVGGVAIAASVLASSAAQRAMSGRVAAAPAPTFALSSPTGKPVTLEAARAGRKAVLLNFWFAACPPCREEFPRLQAMYQRFKPQGLEVVAVNTQDDAVTAGAFARKFGLSFPVAIDEKGEAAAAYKVTATPTNILVDAKGNVIWRSDGFDEEGMRQVLEETLKES